MADKKIDMGYWISVGADCFCWGFTVDLSHGNLFDPWSVYSVEFSLNINLLWKGGMSLLTRFARRLNISTYLVCDLDSLLNDRSSLFSCVGFEFSSIDQYVIESSH